MENDDIISEIEKRLISSCNIVENSLFRDWYTTKLIHDNGNFEQLFEPNMDNFLEIFGQYQFSFKIEKKYMVWRLLKGPNKMYCICHSGGTFYEVYYSANKSKFNDDEKIGMTIIKFIEFVFQKLSQLAKEDSKVVKSA